MTGTGPQQCNTHSGYLDTAKRRFPLKRALPLLALFFAGICNSADAGLVASVTGPDDGAQLVSNSRFAAFRWVSSEPHFGVSIAAKLEAISLDLAFEGTAYLTRTVGPGTSPADEVAHTGFDITSTTASFIDLFQGLTLAPSNYWLTITGSPSSGLWVAANPAFLMGSADTGIAGGVGIADGFNSDVVYPPSSTFISSIQPTQTQFIVTDSQVPEPSSIALLGTALAGLAAVWHGAKWSKFCR